MNQLIKTAVTSVEHQMLNQTSKTCFSRIGEMNNFFKKRKSVGKKQHRKDCL
jgi:hypothetical protein